MRRLWVMMDRQSADDEGRIRMGLIMRYSVRTTMQRRNRCYKTGWFDTYNRQQAFIDASRHQHARIASDQIPPPHRSPSQRLSNIADLALHCLPTCHSSPFHISISLFHLSRCGNTVKGRGLTTHPHRRKPTAACLRGACVGFPFKSWKTSALLISS
jgi:hypothetical protein